MGKSILSSIKSCTSIEHYKKWIVVSAKVLWILDSSGSLLFKFPKIKSVRKTILLSENRLLCEAYDAYWVISLENGDTLWHYPLSKKWRSHAHNFALTPDGTYVYDYYREECLTFYYVRINLVEYECDCIPIPNISWVEKGISSDENGEVNILFSATRQIMNRVIQKNGVLLQPAEGMGSTFYWKNQWDDSLIRFPLGMRQNLVLLDDFSVLNYMTGETIHLIDNNEERVFPQVNPSFVKIDQERYLNLIYSDRTIIIDCYQRKIVAQYNARFSSGCLIDDEYWIGDEEKIVKKPFPSFEEPSLQSTIFIGDIIRSGQK